MEWHNIGDVLQGHDRVSPVFRHGDHEGFDAASRQCSLYMEAGDLATPVVASFAGKLWTVYGNRRVCSLRAYANALEESGRTPEKSK